MNSLNRLIVVLFAAVLIAGSLVTILVASEALDPDFLPGGDESIAGDAWFEPQLQGLVDAGDGEKTAAITLSIIVAIVMTGLVLVELIPSRRRESLQIASTMQGLSTIDASSIELLAERTGLSNRSVTSLKCRIRVKGKSGTGPARIIINCYPKLILGSNVQEVRDDLQARIAQSVQQLTGLTVLQVNVVRVRYERGETSRLMGA